MSILRTAGQSLRAASARSPIAPVGAFVRPSLFHTSAVRWALSDASRKKIDAAVQAHPLVVFMKGTPESPMCGFSRAVLQILQVQGVDPSKFKTYNVLDDQELREGIKEYSEWPTIPQVYVKGEFTGGCDIMLSMHQSGELEQLLKESELLAPAPAQQTAA